MTRLLGKVEKAWGYENIVISTDDYCGKIMHFTKGSKFSMHFHHQKMESWYVMSGEFILEYICTKDAKVHQEELHQGDTRHIHPLLPHRLICITEGDILEVSTPDSVEDNYRVLPGDSQQ